MAIPYRFHPIASDAAPATPLSGSLEGRVAVIGAGLSAAFSAVIDAVPAAPHGPVGLARALGLDKVLTSRLLKAARHRDPIAVTHLMPGPDPLRKLLRAARKVGVETALIQQAEAAVDSFEALIRHEAGDRSGLDAIISTWLPEARKPFELRRKQSAFKAMSQIKGAAAETNLATVLIRPSADGERLDVVWILGLIGLQRLRPGAAVRFTSRRMGGSSPRRPTTLVGRPVEGEPESDGLLLREYSSDPPPDIVVRNYGEAVHYLLGGDDFGPRSAVDLVFAEANFNEIERYVPKGSGRKGYFFAEVSTPVKSLLFDAYLHKDVYPAAPPELHIYDTVLEGVASVNDRSRDIDRLDLAERIEDLGPCNLRSGGFARAADVPNYTMLLRDVFTRLEWSPDEFRGHRCRIEYPIYGSQVAMAFTAPER